MLGWALIGIIVGAVAGLTGAGGAIVSVPLFIHLAGTSLKEATLYGLFAIVAASLPNWWVQRRDSLWKLSATIATFSILGSKLAVGPKQSLPDWVIQIFFAALCLLSLVSVWKPGKKLPQAKAQDTKTQWILTPVLGVFIGIVTTITGLGGGVVLVPAYLAFYGLTQSQAVATSLFTIFFNANISIFFQRDQWFGHMDWGHLGILILGCIASAFALKAVSKKTDPKKMDLIRKALFSGMVVLSLAGIYFK